MDNSQQVIPRIKAQILQALAHPEAEEGLYFRNFVHLHEEDEREAVEGDEEVIQRLNFWTFKRS